MGEKSVQKKQFIVETARLVFVEKGFKNVTMKDIVDACGISRGGLYLYFDSTEALFREVLETERMENYDPLPDGFPDNAGAADMLLFFLREQKRDILRRKNCLAVATYEYFFEAKLPKRENPMCTRFSEMVDMLTGLLCAGVESGEFCCVDPEGAARNLFYVLEGLRVSAQTMGLSESMVDRELMYVLQGLVYEE